MSFEGLRYDISEEYIALNQSGESLNAEEALNYTAAKVAQAQFIASPSRKRPQPVSRVLSQSAPQVASVSEDQIDQITKKIKLYNSASAVTKVEVSETNVYETTFNVYSANSFLEDAESTQPYSAPTLYNAEEKIAEIKPPVGNSLELTDYNVLSDPLKSEALATHFPDYTSATIAKVTNFIAAEKENIFSTLQKTGGILHKVDLLQYGVNLGLSVIFHAHIDENENQYRGIALMQEQGAGSWKKMYRSYDLMTGKQRAITTISDSAKTRDQILAEKRGFDAVKGMPQFLKSLHVIHHGDQVVFMAPFCNRGTVGQWLKESPPVHELLYAAMLWSGGLKELHAKGYIHCDAKLDNVMLKTSKKHPYGFKVKVIDYGCMNRKIGHRFEFKLAGPVALFPPEWVAMQLLDLEKQSLKEHQKWIDTLDEGSAKEFEQRVLTEKIAAWQEKYDALIPLLDERIDVYMLGVSLLNMFYNIKTPAQVATAKAAAEHQAAKAKAAAENKELDKANPLDRDFFERELALSRTIPLIPDDPLPGLAALIQSMLGPAADRPSMAQVESSLQHLYTLCQSINAA